MLLKLGVLLISIKISSYKSRFSKEPQDLFPKSKIFLTILC